MGIPYMEMLALGIYSMTYCTLWNATPRIFPTVLRSSTTGIALSFGQLGSMSSPLILPILERGSYISYILLAIPSVILIPCFFFFYSVHRRELPDILEDMANFSRYLLYKIVKRINVMFEILDA